MINNDYGVMNMLNTVEPLYKGHQKAVFQKRWPVMRGKINMICKEWCMEMDQILQL